MSKLLENLNPEQLEAVTHFGSPLLIVAGAGSGKTTVLTRKIAYMIQELGVTPQNILGITFTNKAAKEMRERVAKLNASHAAPFLGTFHAFCVDVLRRDYHHLGRSRSFNIADQQDQTQIIKALIKARNLSENTYSPNAILYRIQDFKNRMLVPGNGEDRHLVDLFHAYQKQLKDNELVDFNDLINEVVILFQTRPEVLSTYQDYYNFILVDEYQDTNQSQYTLVNLLAKAYQNITVVGDFDQNIYSWRGANIRNMLNFEKDYPTCKTIYLEQNYRSTKRILETANHLIANNQTRKEKNLWTENESGEKIHYIQAPDERAEARHIAKEIITLSKDHAFSEMVILYRTNAQSRIIEEALVHENIPYQVLGGLKFFARADIKDILSYLRLIHNPQDLIAFRRVANVPTRGIGETSLSKFITFCETQGLTLTEGLAHPELSIPTRAHESLAQFFKLINSLQAHYQATAKDRIAELIQAILSESGYAQMIKNDIQKGTERLETLSELVTMAREEETELGEYLAKVALVSDLDDTDENPEVVTLMTMHTAKGLEFEVVFIPGMEEGILPHYKSKLDGNDVEEERRLCYVAITRAKKRAYLLSANQRLIFGELWRNEPSRFLDELPPEHIEKATQTINMPTWMPSKPSTTFTTSSASTSHFNYTIGESVHHAQWGQGFVQKVDGEGEKMLLVVTFATGTKKLLAKYAPLQKVLA